jgi:hypothetical protein
MSSWRVRSLRACWRLLNAAVIVKESRTCFEDGENAVDAAGPKWFWRVEIAPNYITDFNNTSRRRAQVLVKVVQVVSVVQVVKSSPS